ncbi:(2Fe-2S) ferredoxin domain-containing protein [Marivirga tractuosa]|uniref:(2Fe-2S) ferredoxin domain-containing protein n=1 Tax=Marivirga tractuosa TaxID=1006 RepID=UPI0005A0B9D2|nr:(2Fe-2S) ferredoxin domain-containing protein [Marivirga tractuosa]
MKPTENQNHHIFICTGKDCKKNGCEELKNDLKKSLKSKGIKNLKLIKTKCMDYCKLGPNIVVTGELLHHCKSTDIPEIIEKVKN